MAIDLIELQKKFDALLEDPNFVSDFEDWLSKREVKPSSSDDLSFKCEYHAVFTYFNDDENVIFCANCHKPI